MARTILLAEDDDAVRELLAGILTDAGYEVRPARDGLEAWNTLRTSGADMALTDLNMPRMDGLELLRLIRADSRLKGMPVMMLTIQALAQSQIEAYDLGADDYLPKPFDNDMLVAKVRALERRVLGPRPAARET